LFTVSAHAVMVVSSITKSVKAPIEREKNDACISSSEREAARLKVIIALAIIVLLFFRFI
jgi:hypothetical protein